jgi:putative ribosome biogenesis GTPase RsgA
MPKLIIQNLSGYSAVLFLDAATIKKFVGKEKRLLCTINKETIHCAIMNSKEYGYYIMLGKATLKKINCAVGDEVNAVFTKDESVIQFAENKILSEVFSGDDMAKKIFNSLTDGNKRGIIALANQPKTENKQIERALLIAEKLKLGITQPMKMMKKD